MMSNYSSDLEELGQPSRYHSLFISDLHLGTKGAQAEACLELLCKHDAETIYLVRGIVDGWLSQHRRHRTPIEVRY